MHTRIKVLDVLDFSGGLNTEKDAFQLQDNESTSLLNVDLDPIGGFGARQGLDVYSKSTPFAAVEGDGAQRFLKSTTSHVTIPDNALWSISTNWSLEAWVNIDANDTLETIVSKSIAAKHEWILQIAGGFIEFAIFRADGATNTLVKSDAQLVVGRWYHIVFTHGATADEMFLYVDGVLQQDTRDNTQLKTVNNSTLDIGRRAELDRYFSGMIDEVAIYPSTLTLAKVQAHYDAMANAHDSMLTSYSATILADTPSGYWRLGESSGTNANDLGAADVDGTYAGGTNPVPIPAGVPGNLLQYASNHAETEIIVSDRINGDLWISPVSGSTWTQTKIETSGRTWAADSMNSAIFRSPLGGNTTGASRLYMQDGIGVAWLYNSVTTAVLGTTFVDDLTAPTNGNMPQAKYITAHMGRMWVANTTEGDTVYKNRIRWSHPNKPEDWRSQDSIDIDIGQDGDQITGLLPFGKSLLVFKSHSIHVITGYDQTSFKVEALTNDVGAVNQNAIASLDLDIYFWDIRLGLFVIERKSPRWIGKKIQEDLKTKLTQAKLDKVSVTRVGKRIYIGVPWTGDLQNSRTYILDPTLATTKNKDGSFTFYDYGTVRTMEVQGSVPVVNLALIEGSSWIMKVESTDLASDIYGLSRTGTTVHNMPFETTYTTAWYDVDGPGTIKKWRRPTFIVDGDEAIQLRIDVWRDYDPNNLKRTFFVNVGNPTSGAAQWGTAQWGPTADPDDQAQWVGSGEAQEIIRGSNMGRARSVQFAVTGPADGTTWAVNAVSLKYVPLRVRS